MQASGKDLLTLLKEEDSTLKRKDLLEKLVDDSLWATKSVYKEIIPERELQDVKKLLKNLTFQFSPILRSWIPKPNKPGKMRPITQPAKKDKRVMLWRQSLSY